MVTPRQLSREDVLRLRSEGRLSADEATTLLNQIDAQSRSGRGRRFAPDSDTGALSTLSALFNPLDIRNTSDIGPVTVKTPLAQLGAGLATAGFGLGGGTALATTRTALGSGAGRSIVSPVTRALSRVFGRASLGTGLRSNLGRGAAVAGGGLLAANALTGQGDSAVLPTAEEIAALRPVGTEPTPTPTDAEELGRSIAQTSSGEPGTGAFETREQTLSDGTVVRLINIPGVGWLTEDELRGQTSDRPFLQTREGVEFQAALESAAQGRQAQTQREQRFLEDRRRQVAETRAFERQQQLQRQALSAELLGQLFGIAASPSQRLRFLASQARGGNQLASVAQASGLSEQDFQNLLNTSGLNPAGQTFTVENQLASMFGLQPGRELTFTEPTINTGIIPNLGQIADLTPDEQAELGAITDVFFGRDFGDVARQSRRLAPPGGSNLSVGVR